MMNWGWSAELGVSCNHCHVIGKWESDSIQKKDIAKRHVVNAGEDQQ